MWRQVLACRDEENEPCSAAAEEGFQVVSRRLAHKLCDLCRASTIFTDANQMAACLRAIGDDLEIQVFKAADETMRLRDDYDS